MSIKKILTTGLLLFSFALSPLAAYADVWVNGYYRSNGTYVNGHWRSSPDGNPYNNYSFPGNTNPYTGKTSTGNASTYLNNYYNNSSGYTSDFSTYKINQAQSKLNLDNYLIPSPYVPTYSPSFEETDSGYKIGGIAYCKSGYYKKNNSCIKAPAHSEAYGFENFYCDDGYVESGSKCVKESAYYKNAEKIGSSWYCKAGYFANEKGDACVNLDAICREDYGKYAMGSGEDKCTCKKNYTWNANETKCVKIKK